MQQDEYILKELGGESFPAERQELILEQVRTLVGEAISSQLTEQQKDEYQAIIDAQDSVIQPWLEQNIPEYKKSSVYQEFEAAYETDPEHNDPAKLFASIAWIELNVKNIKEIIDDVISIYKDKYMPTV